MCCRYCCPWPECGYTPHFLRDLRRHMHKHTGEKRYKCDVKDCDFITVWKTSLLQHQRKKHPEQMAIINSNARARQRTIPNVPITSTLTTQTTNMASNTALSTSPVAISPGVATTNLITILGN